MALSQNDTNDSDLPCWIFAPGFREWIESRRPEWRIELNDSQRRRVQAMRDEDQTRVSLAVVDRICCELDLHINEIPDELWTDGPKTGGPRHSQKTKQAVLADIQNGATVRDAAQRAGISRSTVQHWRERKAA